MLGLALSGEIFAHPRFQETPDHLRRVNDIAFAGDGEPTTYQNFDEIIDEERFRKVMQAFIDEYGQPEAGGMK